MSLPPIRLHDPNSGLLLGEIQRGKGAIHDDWSEATTHQRRALGVMLGAGCLLTWLGFHRIRIGPVEGTSWLLLHRVSKDGRAREPVALDYRGNEQQHGSGPFLEAMKRGCAAGLTHSKMATGRRASA